jgi:hypothetical protein
MRKRTMLIVLVAALALAAFFGAFGYSSICTNCGAIEHTTEWQLPFTQLTVWRSHSIEATPLSRVVDHRQLALASGHAWIFASGGGNGVTCAIGPGRHIYSAVLSPEVATFIDAMSQYRGTTETRRWLASVLDPNHSMTVEGQIRFARIPPAGFTGQAQFDAWWRNHHDHLGTLLDELMSNDPDKPQ